jgi:hypothetical protein
MSAASMSSAARVRAAACRLLLSAAMVAADGGMGCEAPPDCVEALPERDGKGAGCAKDAGSAVNSNGSWIAADADAAPVAASSISMDRVEDEVIAMCSPV